MSLSNDCRLAARALVRDRWYAAVVIATLGLGIGLTTIAFTLVNAVVLRGLPYDDTDRHRVAAARRCRRWDAGLVARLRRLACQAAQLSGSRGDAVAVRESQ